MVIRDTAQHRAQQTEPPYVDEEDLDDGDDHLPSRQEAASDKEGVTHPRSTGVQAVRVFRDHSRNLGSGQTSPGYSRVSGLLAKRAESFRHTTEEERSAADADMQLLDELAGERELYASKYPEKHEREMREIEARRDPAQTRFSKGVHVGGPPDEDETPGSPAKKTPRELGREHDTRGVHVEPHGHTESGNDLHYKRTADHGKAHGYDEPRGSFTDGGAYRDEGRESDESKYSITNYDVEGSVGYGSNDHPKLAQKEMQLAKEALMSGTPGAYQALFQPAKDDDDED